MTINDYSTLNIGDKVGVACHGSWAVRSEGIYAVVKKDKVKIVVQRESDKYERTFNIKSKTESGRGQFRTAFLETVEEQEQRDKTQAHEAAVRNAWHELGAAVGHKSVERTNAAIAHLKELGILL